MADRSTSATFYPSNDPNIIRGRINAENDDYFLVPYGTLVDCLISSQDDDDIIVSADCAGAKITLGCVSDDGNALAAGNDFDMVFKAIIKTQ